MRLGRRLPGRAPLGVALGLIPASDERRRIAAEPAARGLRTLPRRVEITLGVESLLNV